jgi:hypothetical protein
MFSCFAFIINILRIYQIASVLADNTNDAVAGDETVQLLHDFMDGIEFKGIELGID